MNSTGKKRLNQLEDILALTLIDSIGPKRFFDLMDHFGSAASILNASNQELCQVAGISTKISDCIMKARTRDEAAELCAKIEKLGWDYFLYNDSTYPLPLKNIHDRPAYLFYKGTFIEKDYMAIAIVGSRKASESGMVFARSLAQGLAAAGVTVISGMARGIDTAAHRGALEAGGRTIAVWGSSLDIIYPPENRALAADIVQSGCIISEFLPETTPIGPNFPRRNRIISGLSQGVVVIEAAEQSGALSTANHALSQNREVFAVPGSPRSTTSRGTNRLLKEGATLVTSVEDIFEALPRLKSELKAEKARNEIELTPTEKNLIDLFDDKPIHIDKLAQDLAAPVTDLMPILLALELKGVLKELSGKRYILN